MANIAFLRIDGKSSPQVRQKRLDKFNTTPTVAVLIMTTETGGVG
jgi:SNF2 family DNA or RNA helicase